MRFYGILAVKFLSYSSLDCRRPMECGGMTMKSKTKNRLTGQQIRKLVEYHFGKECEISRIEELKGGMFNASYMISRVKEKDKIVLKAGVVPGTPLLTYEQDIMPTEVECYRLIKEHTTVPVPTILAYDFSKTQINSNYFFMTALSGTTLSGTAKKMDPGSLARIRQKQAEYLAQLHRIKGTYYGYFTEDKSRQYATWKDAFFHMFAQILEDAKEHRVRLPYEQIARVLRENAGYLEDITEPSLVEYDCHDGNIFVKETADGYEIEGIVDFERAFWGDAAADFPAAFIMTDDLRKEKAFLDGYLKASGRPEYTEADAKRYQLYRLYITVIMAAETFRYGFFYSKMQGMWAKAQIKKCLDELEK